MYGMDIRVRYSEVDQNCNITLQAMLDLFQDCCTFQSEELGIGIDFLSSTHSAWILSSWQIIIERLPRFGEKIQVRTWPYNFKGFYGYRNFEIRNEAQEVLAYANSVWVYLDTESGRPIRVPENVLQKYSFEEPIPKEWEARKIKLPKDMEHKQIVPVQHYHIDTNNHVNNAKYVQMAEEFLPAEYEVRQIRVEYRKAAVLSDRIVPMVSQIEDKVLVALAAEDGKPYAIVEFTEKNA